MCFVYTFAKQTLDENMHFRHYQRSVRDITSYSPHKKMNTDPSYSHMHFLQLSNLHSTLLSRSECKPSARQFPYTTYYLCRIVSRERTLTCRCSYFKFDRHILKLETLQCGRVLRCSFSVMCHKRWWAVRSVPMATSWLTHCAREYENIHKKSKLWIMQFTSRWSWISPILP